jgi:hypothetical protein
MLPGHVTFLSEVLAATRFALLEVKQKVVGRVLGTLCNAEQGISERTVRFLDWGL